MEYRKLKQNGKCICCGREILRCTEEAFRFPADKSQVGLVTICKKCIEEMNGILENELTKEMNEIVKEKE